MMPVTAATTPRSTAATIPCLAGFRPTSSVSTISFLINGSGQIVYTVSKEVDFGTNLFDGPYQDSNLATVFEAAQRRLSRAMRCSWSISPPIAPSFGEPASFMAAPIVDGAWLLGVLVFQMPVGEIDGVMTSDRNWQIDGLGETGETYPRWPRFHDAFEFALPARRP